MQNGTSIVKAADYDLDEKRAGEIQASFEPMIVERKQLAQEYEAIVSLEIDEDVCKRAGTLRRQLVKVRTGISSIHKTQKHMFLKAGQFVDAWKNAETLPVEQMEEKLSGIEKHFENIEKLRVDKIRMARAAELQKYEVTDDQIPIGLGQMDDDIWSNYLSGIKAAYAQRKEAEAQAEKERIAKEKAEADERERIRLENETLKKEAAERERLENERIAKDAAERKAIEEAGRKAREEVARLEREKKNRETDELAKLEAETSRKKDKAHRGAVSESIVDAMMTVDAGLSRAVCEKIVVAINQGDIPNVSINY